MEKHRVLLSYRILLGITFQLLALVWLFAVFQCSRFSFDQYGTLTAVAMGAAMSGAFLLMAGLRQAICGICDCNLAKRPSL